AHASGLPRCAPVSGRTAWGCYLGGNPVSAKSKFTSRDRYFNPVLHMTCRQGSGTAERVDILWHQHFHGECAMKKRLICLTSIGLLANVVVWPATALAQTPPGYGANATLHPYTSHLGPRPSGGDFWPDGPQPHFQELPGYDNNP